MSPRPADTRRLVGRYRLDSELGRGAMGTVWSAYDEVLHRPVAVKEVRLSLVPVSERAIVRERTLREARATAMLSHPNVVTLYDVVEVNAEPYVVMELLPSRSLASYIGERGTLSPAETAEIGSAVASALMTAHRAGITHRDVKPGNVLIGTDGQIKLTDFGIARNAAESSMTQTGTVLGSPPYIAPEVAMGRAVGPPADLWGLGATLYACLEGRPPYDAGDPVSTVSAVVHGDVPRPKGHGPVQDVVRGLMVKDPTLRMPLPAVRRRLRPLMADPEGPVLSAPPSPATTEFRLPSTPARPDTGDRSGLIPVARGRDGTLVDGQVSADPPGAAPRTAPLRAPGRSVPDDGSGGSAAAAAAAPADAEPAGTAPAAPEDVPDGGSVDTAAAGAAAAAGLAAGAAAAGAGAEESSDTDDAPAGESADPPDAAADAGAAPDRGDATQDESGDADEAGAAPAGTGTDPAPDTATTGPEADPTAAGSAGAGTPGPATDTEAADGSGTDAAGTGPATDTAEPDDADPDVEVDAAEAAEAADAADGSDSPDPEPAGTTTGTTAEEDGAEAAAPDAGSTGGATPSDDAAEPAGDTPGADDEPGGGGGTTAAAGATAAAAGVAAAAVAAGAASTDEEDAPAAGPADGDATATDGSATDGSDEDGTGTDGAGEDGTGTEGEDGGTAGPDPSSGSRTDTPAEPRTGTPPGGTRTTTPSGGTPRSTPSGGMPVPAPSAAETTMVTPRVQPRRAPTTPGPWPAPGPPQRRPPYPNAPHGPRRPGGPQALASDPGPLPFAPSRSTGPSPDQQRRRRAVVVALVVVLALAGLLGGYVVTRLIGGQPPFSVSLSPDGPVVDGEQLVVHSDDNARYSGTGMGFTALVPARWQQFRLQQPGGDIVVRYVSDDANRELRIDKLVGFYPTQTVADYARLLADPTKVGADGVRVEPLTQVAPARAGASEPVQQTVYRTQTGAASALDDRTTWTRLIPSGTDLWVIRMTAPSLAAGGTPIQFAAVADSFAPPV